MMWAVLLRENTAPYDQEHEKNGYRDLPKTVLEKFEKLGNTTALGLREG